MLLKGKVVLVTGGANGIGRTICKRFCSEGAQLIICDIDRDGGAQLALDLSAEGSGTARFLYGDMSRLNDIEELAAKACALFGRIDVLVNNAGVCNTLSIDELTMEQWDHTHDINLKALFLLSRAVLRMMKSQCGGNIINMGPMAGQNGGVSVGADYSTSKAGVLNLTRTFAKAGAPDVRVNALSPGLILTPMTQSMDVSNRNIPLNRGGTPEEVAGPALFLASDMSGYMTGAHVDINGGFIML